MTYRLARRAADDLIHVYATSVEMFGVAQAERYQDGLEARFAFLVEHPRAARLRDEIDPPVRAYPYKAHIIVYRIDKDDRVHILRIRHSRENWLNE